MSMSNNHTGELPEDLARTVLVTYAEDELTDLPALLRISEGSAGAIAAGIVNQCYAGQWRGRMGAETASRIKLSVENYFRPAEVRHDPVAESAQRNHDDWDPWQKERQLHEPSHVTQLQGAGPGTRIEYIDGDDHDEAA